MTGVFARWQPIYAERGIATFPCTETKTPAVRNYHRFGVPGSTALVSRFCCASALGFMCGRRSGITPLDIDCKDERVLADALDRHGKTPVVARSGSGNFQAWYKHNGERRQIRPWPELPIDILGGGFVVAPPSHVEKGNYQFVQGSLDDLAHLPHLHGLPANVNGHTGSAAPQSNERNERIREGARNTNLWKHCMRTARHCDDFVALLDVARTRNAEFYPPLGDDEVVKAATSAWDYTERGENRFGRPGVFFDADEANRLIVSDQDAFVLLAYLRANNRPDRAFMIANGMANKLGWPRKRLAAARTRLGGSYVERIRTASSFSGAAIYQWKSKGGQK